MLAVAAIYSLTSVIGKIALQYVSPLTFGPFYFLLLGFFTLTLFSIKQPGIVRVLWRRPHWHLLIGIMMGSMIVTHFMAIAKVEVAYMITVNSMIKFLVLDFMNFPIVRHLEIYGQGSPRQSKILTY
jgi:drug/metabolite transporter (DMT)-like permease